TGSMPPPAMIARRSPGRRRPGALAVVGAVIILGPAALGQAEIAAAARTDERRDVGHQGIVTEHRGGLGDILFHAALALEDLAIGAAQFMDLLARHAGALHADYVEPAQSGAVANRHAERDHVSGKTAAAADEGMMADAHELVHGGQTADIGVIANLAMAGERRLVGHDDAIADDAVMGDMGIGHEEAAVSDPGDPAAAVGAPAHGHALADDAVLADFQRGRPALVA